MTYRQHCGGLTSFGRPPLCRVRRRVPRAEPARSRGNRATSASAEKRTHENWLLDALASEGDRPGTALTGQREGAGRSQSQTGREGFAIQR